MRSRPSVGDGSVTDHPRRQPTQCPTHLQTGCATPHAPHHSTLRRTAILTINVCPCQNDATNHAGSSSSTAGAAACWVIKLIINLRTAITQAGLPYYNRKDPQQGSKQARDSILKLLTGMNDDVQPLNFRSELKQNGDKDPYYPAAPAWSTLSGGNNPTHLWSCARRRNSAGGCWRRSSACRLSRASRSTCSRAPRRR